MNEELKRLINHYRKIDEKREEYTSLGDLLDELDKLIIAELESEGKELTELLILTTQATQRLKEAGIELMGDDGMEWESLNYKLILISKEPPESTSEPEPEPEGKELSAHEKAERDAKVDGVELHKTKIITDGGPWAEHDRSCPIYESEPAVYDLSRGIFEPSWKAQKEGWKLIHIQNKILQKLIDWYFGS